MKLDMRSPWVLHHEKLKALFKDDGDVEVEYAYANANADGPVYTIRVASGRKADALSRLIPPAVEFGNVAGRVNIVPGNRACDPLPADANAADVAAAAFEGNPIVVQVRQVSKGLFRDLAYCVFRREVVQYQADNLADVNGNVSTLAESLAREVMTLPLADQVMFCTSAVCTPDGAIKGLADAPLGEWP